MKKMIFALILASVLLLTGCGTETPQSWDCTVSARGSEIVCSAVEMSAQTGTLSFQNRNAFPITLHLYENGLEQQAMELASGGACAFRRLNLEAVYTVGLEGKAGEKAVCIAFDGTEQTPYQMERKGEGEK